MEFVHQEALEAVDLPALHSHRSCHPDPWYRAISCRTIPSSCECHVGLLQPRMGTFADSRKWIHGLSPFATTQKRSPHSAWRIRDRWSRWMEVRCTGAWMNAHPLTLRCGDHIRDHRAASGEEWLADTGITRRGLSPSSRCLLSWRTANPRSSCFGWSGQRWRSSLQRMEVPSLRLSRRKQCSAAERDWVQSNWNRANRRSLCASIRCETTNSWDVLIESFSKRRVRRDNRHPHSDLSEETRSLVTELWKKFPKTQNLRPIKCNKITFFPVFSESLTCGLNETKHVLVNRLSSIKEDATPFGERADDFEG
jgi:hypothetical protein